MSGEECRSILEDDTVPWRLETAALDQCLGVMMTSEVHSTELLQDHENVVSRAAAERRKRPHMRTPGAQMALYPCLYPLSCLSCFRSVVSLPDDCSGSYCCCVEMVKLCM